jgi:CRP/FNR family transcriptional regulator, anaerobic regulatory protein
MGDGTMTTPCRECPLRKKECFSDMTSDEVRFMERFKSGELKVAPGTTILMQGSSSPQLFTVLEGMGLRQMTTRDGARQVLNFVLPGDFIGLQAGLIGEMQHSVEATTAMTLCVFRREDLWKLFQSHPGRAFDLTWLAAMEERFLGEAITTVGQRPAIERVAWALARLYRRLSALGLERDEGAVPLPYRQQDLADALGLSLVHTNKTLRRLQERQILCWSQGVLRALDPQALFALADVNRRGSGRAH